MANEDQVEAPQISTIIDEFATFGVTLSDEVANQCECRLYVTWGEGEGGELQGSCGMWGQPCMRTLPYMWVGHGGKGGGKRSRSRSSVRLECV